MVSHWSAGSNVWNSLRGNLGKSMRGDRYKVRNANAEFLAEYAKGQPGMNDQNCWNHATYKKKPAASAAVRPARTLPPQAPAYLLDPSGAHAGHYQRRAALPGLTPVQMVFALPGLL